MLEKQHTRDENHCKITSEDKKEAKADFQGGKIMKMYVNENCIGCGLCEGLCPNVFHINENGVAQAIEGNIDAADTEDAMNALNSCPVGAIEEA